jgi:uncharacterized membrane protein
MIDDKKPMQRMTTQVPDVGLAELPESIRTRLRTGAPAEAIDSGATGAGGFMHRLRDRLARVRGGSVSGEDALATAPNPAVFGRVGALARGLPARLALNKLAVPQISPEFRDGLVKHGRRAGLNIGTAIDKIIRDVPVQNQLSTPVSPVTTDIVEAGSSDIRTVALQRAVKQPSVFAPGHILTALLAGGIIHIATTFAITSLGTGSAFRQLRAALPVNELVVLPAQSPTTQLLPFLAPDMLYAICRYDLSAGGLEVTAMLPEAGWSLALYTRQGDNFYAAPGQSLRPVPVAFLLSQASDRLVNITPGVRKSDVDIGQVTSPDREGLVVVRAPLKGLAFEAATRAELTRAACKSSKR